VSHAWNTPGSDAVVAPSLTMPETAPWWWAQLRAQRPIVARRLADLPPEAHAERALLASCGVGAVAAVPLSDGGVLRGFLGLSAARELLPTADDLTALLRVVGDILLGALDRAGAVLGLRDSERRFRELVENLSAVICTIDLQGRLTYASPTLQTLAGVPPEDLIGRPFRDLILPDHRAEVATTFARVLAGQRVASELRVRLASGTERWVRTTSCPLVRDGVVTAIQVVIEDITDGKQVEEQRQLLALLTEQAPIGIVQTDAAGQVTAANPIAVGILGSPSPDATAQLNVLTVPALHAVGADVLFRAALERRERGSIEGRYRSHWGKESFVQLHVAPLFDALQRVRGTVAVVEEVTARRLAEQALREREARLRSLIDGLGSAVLVGLATPDGHLVEASRSALELTGVRIEDVRGLHVADLPPFLHSGALRAGLREAVQRAGDGVATQFDVSLRIGAGDERTLDFHVQPLRGAGGEVVYIIGSGVDITDRHRAQHELARLNDELERRVIERTTQLAAANSELEAFTSSVSHDLRSPLRAIHGFSHSLLEGEDGQLADPARRDIERIRAAATRMQQLIDALLELARVSHGPLRRAAVDLSQLAAAQAAELQRADPQRQVTFAIADGMVADGDARLLQVVLANLLDNAWKYTAMRAQAHIAVAVETVGGERAFVVRDDGVGFDPNDAAQLFVPFRRLHGPEFAGSGVGLATVARIVERHGGRIWATAVPDRGASFFFTLGAGSGS
jgi:PAS domain S-box-containing protein